MRKTLVILFAIMAVSLLLAACSGSDSGGPAQAVEEYLNTLVAKDADRLPTLVCGTAGEVSCSLKAVSLLRRSPGANSRS